MSFTGNEDHAITLQTASDWTANFRAINDSGTTIAHFFGKNALLAILEQTNCVGIRAYYALNDSGSKEIVVVGVDNNENDIFNGLIASRSTKCPTSCSNSNPFNS